MSNPIIYCSSAENYFLTCIRSISFDLVFFFSMSSFMTTNNNRSNMTQTKWKNKCNRIILLDNDSVAFTFCSFYILFDWLVSIEYKHSLYIRLTYSEVRWQVKTCNAAKIVRLYYFYTSELAYQLYLCKDININLAAISLEPLSVFLKCNVIDYVNIQHFHSHIEQTSG